MDGPTKRRLKITRQRWKKDEARAEASRLAHVEAIREANEKGDGYQAIANELGVSKAWIQNVVNRRGKV